MIKELASKPFLPKKLIKKINKLKPLTGGEWDLRRKDVLEFKSLLKKQLLVIQDGKCAYCGLCLQETSRVEIEHIAPKGGKKLPQHTELAFTILNLVLACNLCNCTEKKGTYDTINTKNENYLLNDFHIVHPYLDDHSLHYQWSNNLQGDILIQAKSAKGLKSIELFELDSPHLTQARVKQNLYEQVKLLPDAHLILAASAYRC